MLLGKYRVETTLGFGGMGLVIRAHNLAIDEKVAIKMLREDVRLGDEHVTRFLREAKAAVRLKSEHVAKISDVGTLEDGRPYMVMELLEGLDLGKLLIDDGAIEPARAVDLILQACDALAEAHALGIVHRDIKPSNLFVTKRRDESDLLKVLDFGISKAPTGTELSLTQTSSMLGTPQYMSPEQMRSARTVDSRSDIWALGTVLYELVEGRPPFEAGNFAELCIMVSTEPPAPMTRAPQLSRVIERALAKTVDERYQNVGELAADLELFADDRERARRQVARIHRVLGTASAADATPLPTRESLERLPFTPAPTVVRARRPGLLRGILIVAALFGVGIAAGLAIIGIAGADARPAIEEATIPDPDAAPSPGDGSAGPLEHGADTATPPADAEMPEVAAPPVDAGAIDETPPARERTLRKPAHRKSSPRRSHDKPADDQPADARSNEKCNVWDNPKGCKT